MTGKEKQIKDTNNKEVEGGESTISIKKWLIFMTAITIILVVSFFLGAYMMFVRSSKKLVNETAQVYATGTGSDLLELLCPDYVDYFNENYNFSSMEDTYQSYIDEFRDSISDQTGKIKKIKVKVKSIYSVKNIDSFEKDFAQYGVKEIQKYNQVNMEWNVTGEKGTAKVEATAFVIKYKGKWHLDYINFAR